jgi:hypothetical protein
MHWRKLWLCLPPTLLALLDHALTLFFQPDTYWAGDFSTAKEANPHASWLMQTHPIAIEVGFVAWLALVWSLILILPRRLALALSLGVTMGHTMGTASWLPGRVPAAYWLSVALCSASAVLVVLAWDVAGSFKT